MVLAADNIRVGLFLGMDAKYTIPELQRGKCVSRETVSCIMGDVAIALVQTVGKRKKPDQCGGRNYKRTLGSGGVHVKHGQHETQQSTDSGSRQAQMYPVGLGHSRV